MCVRVHCSRDVKYEAGFKLRSTCVDSLNIQSWLMPLSHREPGQRILCTSRGCSKAHRLQQKQHTQKQTFLFSSLTCFQSFLCEGFPTGHVHHATVAVVHQVACFAVYATGRDAVSVEEL